MNSISNTSSLKISHQQQSSLKGNPPSRTNQQIKDLMDQVTRLDEQMEKVNQNEKLDDKFRMERTKSIREQIQQIEAQISQIRTEQMSQQQKDSDQAEKKNHSKDETKMDTIVKIGTAFDSVKTLTRAKEQMERDSQRLKSEVRLDRLHLDTSTSGDDKSKSMMKENLETTVVKKKLTESNEIDHKITHVDRSIAKAYEKIKETVKQANEDGQEPNQSDTVNKDSMAESRKQIDIRI